jgi:NADP-dependent aldehyde dehydrogenase
VFLPGSIAQRGNELAEQFTGSCLMGAGQFCTNPGLVLAITGDSTETLIAGIAKRFAAAPVGTLLGEGVLKHLSSGLKTLTQHGAKVLAGGEAGGGTGVCHQNTLLRVTGKDFLANPAALQTEAFGNASLIVVAANLDELLQALDHLEGNLTGCIYSAQDGSDDSLYDRVAAVLRPKVGRLLNDKMPTGVAVSSAMNHGGPFPATGHPGFTAVGLPATIKRFARLTCYDGVRPQRLPATLQDKNPTGALLRLVDGKWTLADVTPK